MAFRRGNCSKHTEMSHKPQSSITIKAEISKEEIMKLIGQQEKGILKHHTQVKYWRSANMMITLWESFQRNPYPTAKEVNTLSCKTNLDFNKICDWFSEKRSEMGISWESDRIRRERMLSQEREINIM